MNITEKNKEELTAATKELLVSDSYGKVVFTPNPEMLVSAQKDKKFKEVLNSSDINLCDGFGLQLVTLGKLARYPGSDFVHKLCSMACELKRSVFLLGTGYKNTLELAIKNLQELYPGLKISGFSPGLKIEIGDEEIKYNRDENLRITESINKSGAGILLVAFGQIKQEKWIRENIVNLPNVQLAVGVGGALDYVAGVVKRAPVWMRKVGLEWLYRLFRQPERLRRIINATIVFIYYFLKDKYARK